MRKATIQIEDLAIGYRSKQGVHKVAEHIRTSLYSGELTCLLGANGVGKSTLLRTLSGFQPALGGHISVLGRELGSYTDKELSTIVGLVLTEKCAVRHMSVRELVGMGRSPYTGFWGRLSDDDHEKVEWAIRSVGIVPLGGRMVHTLSDGERQKVMIAKALAQETPVIYLDEPTAFLDFPSKVEMMQLLHSLTRRTGKTIFMSTHDLELALQIADRIWLMDREKGIRTGVPEDLALDGYLADFFVRKGIAFDRETGLFRIDPLYREKVNLQGEGEAYAMARKALRRNGILAGREVDSAVRVVAGREGFWVYDLALGEGEKARVRTIEELLEYWI